MSTKRLKWYQKLGLFTLNDIKIYSEMRTVAKVRDALDLLAIVKSEEVCRD